MISKEQKEEFLENLTKTANVTVSARAAGIWDRRELYRLKKTDEEFNIEWDICIQIGKEAFADDARARAQNGSTKPIAINGIREEMTVYETALTIKFLEKDDPKGFRHGKEINISGSVEAELRAMTDEELNKAIEKNRNRLGLGREGEERV